jgi:uncharacterized protein YndB with AHSA1/START domain
MAIIEESVEIKCSPEKVFAYVTDVKTWPKWHSTMPTAVLTSSEKIGVGTTYRGTNHVMGRDMEWSSKVTEYETNKTWGESIISGGTQIFEHLAFAPVTGGTKFTLVYDMKVAGFLKLVSPMVFRTMRKQAKDNLNTLRKILETTT